MDMALARILCACFFMLFVFASISEAALRHGPKSGRFAAQINNDVSEPTNNGENGRDPSVPETKPAKRRLGHAVQTVLWIALAVVVAAILIGVIVAVATRTHGEVYYSPYDARMSHARSV